MGKRDRERRSAYSAENAVKAKQTGASCLRVPSGAKFMQFPEKGEYVIDIIPFILKKRPDPTDKEQKYIKVGHPAIQFTYFAHTIGPENKKVVCPARQSSSPCPVCEHSAKLRRMPEPDEAMKKLINSLNPKERNLFNVIELKKREDGIKILDMSNFLFGKPLREKLETSGERYVNYADPEEGLSLELTVVKESFSGHTYAKVTSVGFRERDKQYKESIVEKAHALDIMPREMSYDEMKTLFEAGLGKVDDDTDDDDRDDDDTDDSDTRRPRRGDTVKFKLNGEWTMGTVLKFDEEEKEVTIEVDGKKGPVIKNIDKVEIVSEDDEDDDDDDKKKKPAKGKKGKAKDEDEDDEDDDEDDEEDEDEDEDDEDDKPKKKGKKSKDDDEDDDDEDEDDEDEDDEDDEDDDKPKKKGRGRPPGKKKKK